MNEIILCHLRLVRESGIRIYIFTPFKVNFPYFSGKFHLSVEEKSASWESTSPIDNLVLESPTNRSYVVPRYVYPLYLVQPKWSNFNGLFVCLLDMYKAI